MALRWFIRPNAYVDSVRLMRISDDLSRLPGVVRAAAVMATPLNVDLLSADGLLPPGVHPTPDDLLVTVLGEDEGAAQAALERLDDLLTVRGEVEAGRPQAPARSLEQAAARSDANLAVIAVPGQYAAGEAFAALRAGLHVFLFSDNVPLEAETRLKALAAEHDLLLMGPDCGTAILSGIGLGFANRVRQGPVGIVGASGTGIQQVCCLLDAAGIGITQAIGTGGRDLSRAVGGSMTRRALHILDRGPAEVSMVISKPPDREAAERLHETLTALSKPVVACLLGETFPSTERVRYTRTLTEAANAVMELLGTAPLPEPPLPPPSRSGTRVHGLYTGGTLCSEAKMILADMGVRHTLLDLGADDYTRGRAHPIIDPRLRASMLADLAERGDIGAVLIDVILGDLAHPDPAETLIPSLQTLRVGANPEVIAVLVGTAADPQGLERQRARLEEMGVRVYASNAAAARAAGAYVGGTV